MVEVSGQRCPIIGRLWTPCRTATDADIATAPRPARDRPTGTAHRPHTGLTPRGSDHAVLPGRRGDTPQTPHPVPAPRRRAVRRGADGRGRVLHPTRRCSTTAIPDRDPLTPRTRPAHRRPGPEPALTPRHLRTHKLDGGRRGPGDRPAATCSPTTTYGSRTCGPTPSRCPERHRRPVPLPGVRLDAVESPFGVLDAVAGRLRRHPHLDDPPLGADRRRRPAARHRGGRPPRPAQALPVRPRPVPGALALLRARPARGRTRRCSSRARRWRCWSGTGAAWTRLSYRATRSTWSAGTAACTRTRHHPGLRADHRARSTSRRPCTRPSRARTS